MNYIVGDIGNTFTKVCILNNKFEIVKSFNFETIKIFKKRYLKKILSNYLNKNLNSNLLFSSVVPTAFKEVKKILRNKETGLKSIDFGKNIDLYSKTSAYENFGINGKELAKIPKSEFKKYNNRNAKLLI